MTRIKWLLAVLAAMFLLGGCGGDDGDDGGDGGSAPEALEGEAAVDALGEAATKTTTYEGGVDASLDLGVTGTGVDQAVSFDALLDAGTRTGEITFDANGAVFTIRLGDGVAWISSPDTAFNDALPEGVEWVEVDPEELSGLGVDTTFDEGGLTPQLYLALGATDVVAGDQSEVNGVPVQSYSFTIDQAAAVEAAPDEAKEAVENAITLEGDNQTIEGDAAIDGEGFMRQMSVTGSAETPGVAEIEVSFDAEYLDFDVDVPSDAPEESTVVPLSEAPDAGQALQGALAG